MMTSEKKLIADRVFEKDDAASFFNAKIVNGIEFKKCQFKGINLSEREFHNVDFRECEFHSVNFKRAIFRKVSFGKSKTGRAPLFNYLSYFIKFVIGYLAGIQMALTLMAFKDLIGNSLFIDDLKGQTGFDLKERIQWAFFNIPWSGAIVILATIAFTWGSIKLWKKIANHKALTWMLGCVGFLFLAITFFLIAGGSFFGLGGDKLIILFVFLNALGTTVFVVTSVAIAITIAGRAAIRCAALGAILGTFVEKLISPSTADYIIISLALGFACLACYLDRRRIKYEEEPIKLLRMMGLYINCFNGVDFKSCTFIDTKFVEMDLIYSDLSGSNFVGCDLSGLKNHHLIRVDKTVIENREIRALVIDGEIPEDKDFSHQNLRDLSIVGRDLSGLDLQNSILFGTNLDNTILTDVKWSNQARINIDERTRFNGIICNSFSVADDKGNLMVYSGDEFKLEDFLQDTVELRSGDYLRNLGIAVDPANYEAENDRLNPDWRIVFMRNIWNFIKIARSKNGKLSHDDVVSHFDGEPRDNFESDLFDFMELAELVYQVTENEWCVPYALSEKIPDNIIKQYERDEKIVIRYTYKKLPRALSARFLVRLHNFLEAKKSESFQWTDGAIFSREGASALLATDQKNRQIVLRIIGPIDVRRQLAGLCYEEFRAIHNSISIEPKEEIIMNNQGGGTGELPHGEKPVVQGFSTQLHNKNILTPLDAFTTERARGATWKPTIFISYSKDDIHQCSMLVQQLIILSNEGLINKYWYDRFILAGNEWDGNIKKELEEANLILFLVSNNFLATNYVMENELLPALARHENGTAHVVPIILENCRWEGTRLGRLNALPAKGTPIAKWESVIDGWQDVAKGLAMVLEAIIEKQATMQNAGAEEE